MRGNTETIIKCLIAMMIMSIITMQSVSSQSKGVAAVSGEYEMNRTMQKFPKIGKYEVLSGDFHIHTNYSDGKPTPVDRVYEAWEYGYDVIAITDHGNYKSYAEAKPVADALGMILIRGLETGMAGKEHLVALGVPADYKPLKSHAWDLEKGDGKVYYQDELNKLKKLGALVVYAHPHVGFNEVPNWGVKNGNIVALEVKNMVVGSGWNTTESHGTWCYPEAFTWALDKNIGVFANSDAHATRKDSGGLKTKTVTLVLAKKRSVKGVMDAIKNGRTIAWFNDMLWAKESIMTDFIKGVIKVKMSESATGKSMVIIENLSPIKFKLTPLLLGSKTKTLDAYEKLLLTDVNAANEFNVKWDSIWINPSANLTTSFQLDDEE